MAGDEEQLAVIGTTVHARRWLWFDDWRTWCPVLVPVAGEGTWPLYPTIAGVKSELLKSWSFLGSEFGDDASRIHVYQTKREADAVKINKDPDPVPYDEDCLPDDWCVNERTALVVCVDWPSDLPKCDMKTHDDGTHRDGGNYNKYGDKHDTEYDGKQHGGKYHDECGDKQHGCKQYDRVADSLAGKTAMKDLKKSRALADAYDKGFSAGKKEGLTEAANKSQESSRTTDSSWDVTGVDEAQLASRSDKK